jgi:hypothetical protein
MAVTESPIPILTERVPDGRAWLGPALPASREMHTDSSMGEAPPNDLGLLTLATARTAYEDHDQPERRRHLVRLWRRAGDRRHFRG